jgi:hypothetical protein
VPTKNVWFPATLNGCAGPWQAEEEAETRLLPTRSFVKINQITKAVKFLDANNFVDVSRRGVFVKPEFINLIGLKNGLEAKVRVLCIMINSAFMLPYDYY